MRNARIDHERAIDNADGLTLGRGGRDRLRTDHARAGAAIIDDEAAGPARAPSSGAISRAMMSEAPPAAHGTMIFTGRCGYVCALAVRSNGETESAVANAEPTIALRVNGRIVLLHCPDICLQQRAA